ncbi:RES family NAD+ phosphorylase [Microbacterium sp.]|uniref:RES family NAD+ phosphorylase n=1 Tax=Microbacterium sp. TaxID=51671 RepID=UPI00334115EE
MAGSPPIFTSVRGTFHRAVDPRFREFAISGSRSAGRYSRPEEPTLYLSSSVDGVEAAMVAHRDARSAALEILEIEVDGSGIFDLRDAAALEAAGIDRADAVAPWQEIVSSGGVPSSWRVRDRLLQAGANGLIDPSRTSPGLWHLVLFRWNETGAPTVRPAES